MARQNASTEITIAYLVNEEEAKVLSEALTRYIDSSEEAGEACPECNSVGEDDEGDSTHNPGCPVTVAFELRAKLGVDTE